MEELVQKFGSEEEAMKFFAIFSTTRGKKKPAETTSKTPPQPLIPEDTTAQTPISPTEESQFSIGAPAHSQPHAEAIQSSSVERQSTRENGGGTDSGELVEGMQRMAVDEQEARTKKEVEGETPVSGDEEEGETHVAGDGEKGETPVFDEVSEGETPVGRSREGDTPVEYGEGETPVYGSLEGETPVHDSLEGETPVVFTEGETPHVFAEGETPVYNNPEGETPNVFTEAETPNVFDEGETPVNTGVQEPEGGGLTEIVDLVNVPEDEDTPINRREARRMARRSLLDDVDEPTQPRRLEFRAPGAGVEMEEDAPGS